MINAAKLLQEQSNVAFLMIGSGPERQRIIELAQTLRLQNVIFDQSPYGEMNNLYSICYASIATLRDVEVAKAMRLSKIFPSLSCGVPVIYSGHGEAADVISTHQCGICVRPEDPEKLAAAINRLASDVSARDAMGQTGRKLVESQYSWNVIVGRWLRELGLESQ